MRREVNWLYQSAASCVWFNTDAYFLGDLSDWEIARFSRLSVPKRQQDWLLGRWVAKHLIRSVHHAQTGAMLPLAQISVQNAASGAPFVHLPVPHEYALSISHSHGHVLCGVSVGDETLGVDLELIESRAESFVQDYFTPEEIAHVRRLPEDQQPVHVTAFWTAKEAMLKLKQVGLSKDTRIVNCGLRDPVEPGESWVPYPVHYASDNAYQAWSRQIDGFIATIVL